VAQIRIKSDLSGTVSKIVVAIGSRVAEDDPLLMLESMKMEIPLVAPRAGRVVEILASEGETVNEGDVLVVLEA
jgi:acetyl-CoA carboxylase biotin carboxyl carrier protein